MARKASPRKASSNEAGARIPTTPRDISLREFFANAIAQPRGFTTLDPVEELTTALDWRIMELIDLYDYMQKAGALRPPTEIIEEFFGRRRVRDAFMSLYDQLLEDRVDIDRLHSGRQRPPNKSTLIRAAFFQALRECEFPDDQIIRAYDRFQSIYEPAEPATQRVRRFRTKKAMSEPVAEVEPKSTTKAKPK
jgi:hypothetical protein